MHSISRTSFHFHQNPKDRAFPTMVRTRSKAPLGDNSVAHAVAECAATPVRESAYNNQALNLLKMTFPRLSVAAIQRALEVNGFLFTPAFEILSRIDIIVGADEDEERALVLADAPFFKEMGHIVLKTFRRMPRPRIVDPRLAEEVNAIPEMNTKENPQDPDTKVEEEVVKQEVAAPEMEVTCECCFGDSPFETMIQCERGEHLFCPDCVQRYVQEQLFGQNTSLIQCMSCWILGCSAGPCTPPDKTRTAFDKHQTSAEIAKANIQGLW
jgi:hypothetical protein